MKINSYLHSTKYSLRVLVVMSVLMFLSFATVQPKIIGVFLTLWVLTVFWNMKVVFFSDGYTVSKFASQFDQKTEEAKRNKQYFRTGVYFVTIPMMIVGLIMMILILVAFFTIL